MRARDWLFWGVLLFFCGFVGSLMLQSAFEEGYVLPLLVGMFWLVGAGLLFKQAVRTERLRGGRIRREER